MTTLARVSIISSIRISSSQSESPKPGVSTTYSKVLTTAKPCPKTISGLHGARVLIGADLKQTFIRLWVAPIKESVGQGRLSSSVAPTMTILGLGRSGTRGLWPRATDAKASRWKYISTHGAYLKSYFIAIVCFLPHFDIQLAQSKQLGSTDKGCI